jgi:hypothetical protein
MGIRRRVPGLWMCAGLWLAAAGLCAAAAAARGGEPAKDQKTRDQQPAVQDLNGRFPLKPSLAPTWSLSVDSLGFAPPGPLYLGQRNALVSLDFLNENQILFTFRVPALLQRVPGEDQADEREIRAVVLDLPSGALDSERSWMVYDRARYLWMLHDGHFLLRQGNNLMEGDASLQLTPLLHFPGPLLTVELDPTQTYLVTNSREPVKKTAQDSSEDATAQSGSGSSDGEESSDESRNPPDIVVRIMDLATRRVMLVSRVRSLVHLPVNTDGYLGSLRGKGVEWGVDLNHFSGGDRILGYVKSACMPDLNFLSSSLVLATACTENGDDALVAMNTAGKTLWVDISPDRMIWPVLTMSADGQRFARETLYVSHSLNAFSPLGSDDIKGQVVKVFDAANGKVVFESPATPILDAGGNVAISPSGRRVAVLNAGAIQVFELPPPAPLPPSGTPAEPAPPGR